MGLLATRCRVVVVKLSVMGKLTDQRWGCVVMNQDAGSGVEDLVAWIGGCSLAGWQLLVSVCVVRMPALLNKGPNG